MIGKKVTVIVDRPIGSYHPKFKDSIYKVNYGYIEGTIGKDEKPLGAYILGTILLPLFLRVFREEVRRDRDGACWRRRIWL